MGNIPFVNSVVHATVVGDGENNEEILGYRDCYYIRYHTLFCKDIIRSRIMISIRGEK